MKKRKVFHGEGGIKNSRGRKAKAWECAKNIPFYCCQEKGGTLEKPGSIHPMGMAAAGRGRRSSTRGSGKNGLEWGGRLRGRSISCSNRCVQNWKTKEDSLHIRRKKLGGETYAAAGGGGAGQSRGERNLQFFHQVEKTSRQARPGRVPRRTQGRFVLKKKNRSKKLGGRKFPRREESTKNLRGQKKKKRK